MRVQALAESVAKHRLAYAAVVGVTLAGLEASSNPFHSAPHTDTEQHLDPAQFAQYCADPAEATSDRSGKPITKPVDQDYASFKLRATGKESLQTIDKQFFSDQTLGAESLAKANPLLAKTPTADIDKGRIVAINVSDLERQILPAHETLKTWSAQRNGSLGLSALACLNGFGAEASFTTPTSIRLPRQAPNVAGLNTYVIAAGDTYTSVAQAASVPVTSVEQSVEAIPAHKLDPGDIIEYQKNGATVEIDTSNEKLTSFIAEYRGAAETVQKEDGVPFQVTLAQAALESGFGTSLLAQKGNALFGIKAGPEWSGPTVSVPTKEVVAPGDLHKYPNAQILAHMPDGKLLIGITALFRAYPTIQASFLDYGNHLKTTPAYAAAFKTASPNAFANVVTKIYATDPAYTTKVTNLVNQIQIQTEATTDDFAKLYASGQYNRNDERVVRAGPACQVTELNGSTASEASLSDEQLAAIAYNNVQAANLTVTGFNAFNLIDNRPQIEDADPASGAFTSNPRHRNYFNGQSNGNGSPAGDVKAGVKYFVLHFDALPASTYGWDGIQLANSMSHGVDSVNYYANYNSQTGSSTAYWLSSAYVNQVVGYNEEIRGIEMAGCDQSAVHTSTIEAALYQATHFLIYNGYVQKGQSVSSVVNDTIRGHEELVDPSAVSERPFDWPRMYSDVARQKMIGLLVSLGYQQ